MIRILQKHAPHVALYILIALGALFGVLFLHGRYTKAPYSTVQGSTITVGSHTVPITIADTPALREQGLSGTQSLAPGTGKLFVFDQSGAYGFWMKDMQYPIDIVWIDAEWKITDITRDVLPESYPTTYYASMPIQYVLEINANEGGVDKLMIGNQLKLEK